MPIQHSHHVSSLIFRISSLPAPSLSSVSRISTFGLRISPDLSGPIMQNEPNSPHAHCPPDPNTRNEPNLRLPTAQIRETNPKSNARRRRATPIFNPHGSGGNAHPPKTQNEPNSPHAHTAPRQKNAKRTQFQPRRTCGIPKNAERTQFYPPYCLMPIAYCLFSAKRTQLHPAGPVENQKTAKRTQSHPQRTCGRPKNAKRTQSTPMVTLPHPKKSKRTHSTNPELPTTNQFIQNEPNYHPPTTQMCKTNPITAYQVSRRPLFQRNEPNPHPRCHPERRAAERSAAAQSRGTCSISIAAGDSKQTNPAHTQKMRNEPNFHPACHSRAGGNPEIPPTNQFRETNPISVETPKSTIYNPSAQSQHTRPFPGSTIFLLIAAGEFWYLWEP